MFLLGMIIGGAAGFVVFAVMKAASDFDDEMERDKNDRT